MSNRRFFGKTTVSMSPVTLGTMRFSPERVGQAQGGLALLQHLDEHGINTYHTSQEYDTHSFFCDVFRQFKKSRPLVDTTHIVKLAAPHFEETDFSAKNLEKGIDSQLKARGIEQIDIVQWLFRQKNNVDMIRIPKLLETVQDISNVFAKLIKSGKVRAFSCFPYSLAFAKIVNQHLLVDGFMDYLNIAERQWAVLIQDDTMNKCGFIAIRPLFAGKIIPWMKENLNALPSFLGENDNQDASIDWALSYPLLHPKTSSIVVSISNESQARAAIKASNQSNPAGNYAEFLNITNFLQKEERPS